MEFVPIAILAVVAFIFSLIDLFYIIIVKRRILETLEKIESEQNKDLFKAITTHGSTSLNTENVVELAKKIRQALIKKFNLPPSYTYPQLLEEVDKKGLPADIKKELSDFFNRVILIEYSNKKGKEEDIERIKVDASDIIKKMGLNLNTQE